MNYKKDSIKFKPLLRQPLLSPQSMTGNLEHADSFDHIEGKVVCVNSYAKYVSKIQHERAMQQAWRSAEALRW